MKWSLEDEILFVELNSTPCNEIGLDMLDFLESVFDNTDIIHQSRAVVMYSTNPKGFSAGADLVALHDGMKNKNQTQQRQEIEAFIDRIHRLFGTIDMLSIPVICVSHGICFGGGFELLLTADTIIAEQNTRFCFPELRLGLIPGFGGIPRLRREVSNQKIRDLLFTGRSVQPAYLGDMISQVVPVGKGLQIATKLATQIKKFKPRVLAQAKSFIKQNVAQEIEKEKILFLEMIQDPEVQNALEKFTQDESAQPYLP